MYTTTAQILREAMDSPSRNPLLEYNNDNPSDDESYNEEEQHEIQENNYITHAVIKDNRRNPSTPVDRYKFAYIVFYILGM